MPFVFVACLRAAAFYMVQITPVFIFMTIDTEVFPVAAVRGVVVMVVVLVVYGE